MNLEEIKEKMEDESLDTTTRSGYELLYWVEKAKALEAENERLKGENESLKIIDENLREAEENFEKSYIRKLEENQQLKEEYAKLKCLALHSMSEYCFAKGTIICANLEFTQQSINEDRKMIHKMNIRDRWGEYFAESYRKMKKALKEGKQDEQNILGS